MKFGIGNVKLTHEKIVIINYIKTAERPARSCPWPPRLAWLAGEFAMAGGSDTITLGTPVKYASLFIGMNFTG
jgi:hypothetical protein